jgi:hypothetical protein
LRVAGLFIHEFGGTRAKSILYEDVDCFRLTRNPSAQDDVMLKPAKPQPQRPGTLMDPRSTGSSPQPRLPDVLGLRGTFKSGR